MDRLAFNKFLRICESLKQDRETVDSIKRLEQDILLHPTRDAKELEDAKIGWMCKDNFGKSKKITDKLALKGAAKLKSSLASLDIDWDYVTEEEIKSNEALYLISDFDNQGNSGVVGSIVKEALLDHLFGIASEQPNSFFEKVVVSERNSLLYGYVSWVWNDLDEVDPTPSYKLRTFIPENSKYGVIDYFAIKDYLSIYDIIEVFKTIKSKDIFEDEGKAETLTGWSSKEIRNIIKSRIDKDKISKKLSSLDISYDSELYVDTVIDMCGEDIDFSQLTSNKSSMQIPVIKLYIQVGKDVHIYTVEDNSAIDNGEISVKSGCYLKVDIRKSSIINQFITLIRDEPVTKDGSLSNYRGIGGLLYSFSKRHSTTMCHLFDKKMLFSSISFAPKTRDLDEDFGIAHFGSFNVLPWGWDASRPTIAQVGSEDKEFLAIDENNFASISSQYSIDISSQLSNRPTKQEVNLISNDSSQSENSKNFNKLIDYQLLLTKIAQKIYQKDEVLECVKNSLMYLMPEIKKEQVKSLLKRIKKVVFRSFPDDTSIIYAALQNCRNENAKPFLWFLYFTSLGFDTKQANMFSLSENNSDKDNIAALENNVFWESREIIASPSQAHIPHLDMHLGKAFRVAKGVEAGEDPIKALNYIINNVFHCNEHLVFVKEHPLYKGRFKEYQESVKQIEDLIPQIQKFVSESNKKVQEEQTALQSQESSKGADLSLDKERLKLELKFAEGNQKLQQREKSFASKMDQIARSAQMKESIRAREKELELQHKANLAQIEVYKKSST